MANITRVYAGLLLGSVLLAISNAYANSPITLRLLATSDVHGHFTGYDYFQHKSQHIGLTHLRPVIEQQRATADIALLIDNGDLIQGSPLTEMLVAQHQTQSGQAAPKSIADLLDFIGYDAVNLGNHEFNYGLTYLHHAYFNNRPGAQQIPMLSANLHAQSELAKRTLTHKPFHLFNLTPIINGKPQRLKVAVVGVLPPQIMQWDAHHLTDHVDVSSMIAGARRAIQQAKSAQADIIILAAHTGMPKHSPNGSDTEQGIWQLAQLANVDAIIFGHQHALFPGTDVYNQLPHVNSEAGTIFGIPAVQPGTQGSHLGVIDLQLSYAPAKGERNASWQIVDHASKVVAAAAAPDTELTAYLKGMHEATQRYMQQPIGFTQHDLSLAHARIRPTHALQFIHLAQLWYAKPLLNKIMSRTGKQLPIFSAVAPFNAALTEAMYNTQDFTLIPQGVVSLGHIGDLYRYPNTLDVVKVNGVQLKQWLEQAAAAFTATDTKSGALLQDWQRIEQSVPSYQFDTFFGFDYQIDTTMPIGERVNATISFAETTHYYVVTNNYRANGGGDFADLDGSQIVFRAPDQIQHILVRYLQSLGDDGYQQPLVENWKLKD